MIGSNDGLVRGPLQSIPPRAARRAPAVVVSCGILLVLCLLFTGRLWAAGDRLPIWKVTTGQAEIVLLGSVHLAFANIYPLRPEIETAFDRADTLVVEVDVGGPNALAIQQTMLQRGLLPEGETLPGQLSAPVWKSLEHYLQSRGLPLEGFMSLQPGLVVATLSTMRLMEMGMRPDMGIDQHFLGLARHRKPILELETAQQQIDLLLGFPDQDLLMEQTLMQLDEIDLHIRPIYEAWKMGDAARLSELLLEDELAQEPRFQPLYEAMFDRRNEAMTEHLVGYLQGSGSYFVVVGAGHLVGQKGIISLLEQRGFDVQQL
ncbi:MAG: TraB/GumN family protein [Halioglobus sp.]